MTVRGLSDGLCGGCSGPDFPPTAESCGQGNVFDGGVEGGSEGIIWEFFAAEVVV